MSAPGGASGTAAPLRRAFARVVLAGICALLAPASIALGERPQSAPEEISAGALPEEARDTLALIKRGGPFPYRKDGGTFGNREKRLPARARGYYREYTVPTPGARDRGARRIVAGRGGEYYYTADHYNTFKRIRE